MAKASLGLSKVLQKTDKVEVMIRKLFILIAIAVCIVGCTSNSIDSVKAYTYFIDINACKQKKIDYCPIMPVSEVLFALSKNSSTITYRDITLNDSNLKTYGKLENCTVFDNQNFRCDDLELIDGRFHLINAFSINAHGEIVKNNDNFFSNYFAISSSKSLYYMNGVKPIVPLGLFNQVPYDVVYVVMLLMLILIPLGLLNIVYILGIFAFEFISEFFAARKN